MKKLSTQQPICGSCNAILGSVKYAKDGRWVCKACLENPNRTIGVIQQPVLNQIGGGQHMGEFSQMQVTQDDLCQNVVGIQADLVGFKEHIQNLQKCLAEMHEEFIQKFEILDKSIVNLDHDYPGMKKVITSLKGRITKLEKKNGS